MTIIINEEKLAEYTSYDYAWLGPILYPLTLALGVFIFLAFKRCTEERPRATVIDTVAGFVCAVELFFTICCLIQCIVNFSNRSFVGGHDACAVQAFYSTVYSFSALGAVVIALAVGNEIITTSRCTWTSNAVLKYAGGIVGASVLLACCPLLGIGSYIFAVDYCMYNLEGGFFQTVFALSFGASAYFVGCFSLRSFKYGSRSSVPDVKTQGQLALVQGLFWDAIWLPAVMIWVLAMTGNGPLNTKLWRMYGANAIILHSQQLGNAILYGWLWRKGMSDLLLPMPHSDL